MYIYLSKKIAIPNNSNVKCLSWNGSQGWIATGGENGLLKVLKLESSRVNAPKQGENGGRGSPSDAPGGGGGGGGGGSSLSMNQTLEGHNGSVMVVTWNETHRKLTTSDQNGLIIVWMLHKGMWFEEMINNRNKSVVRDMKWTSDGQKICIIYEDGAVIVGSVDGNRLWGKELDLQLALVEWSPDGRLILFCTVQGECHIFDPDGNPLSTLHLFCMEGVQAPSPIIGLDWYDGPKTADTGSSLAIAMKNGRIQLMSGERDNNAIVLDTGMVTNKIRWNANGTVLAIAGTQRDEGRDGNVVQFFSNKGEHLRSMRVPGSNIESVTWEGQGLRIALAVDSYIYFANVRPNYVWAFFGSTLVYAYAKPDRSDHCVMFWDTKLGEKYAKYVKRLVGIVAHGDHCVLVTRGEEPGTSIFILCNAIGSPTDSKYIDMDSLHYTMSDTHLVVANAEVIYTWQYNINQGRDKGIDARKEGRELLFHVDDTKLSKLTKKNETSTVDKFLSSSSFSGIEEPICALTASSSALVITRENGSVYRYSLPILALESEHSLRCRPQSLALNSDSTRMSVIDTNGTLSFFDFASSPSAGNDSATPMRNGGDHLTFERKDVWDMKWSADDPQLFAVMEKTRMYIYRGLVPEEPIVSSGYICDFRNLQVHSVLLDDVMMQPSLPDRALLLNFETKSLRDTRELLGAVSTDDAYQFIEDNSHPRLWRLLADHALQQLQLPLADKAFVHSADYHGIQLVKRLGQLVDSSAQKAEIAAYFGRFEEAEALYRQMDRMDLAVTMRTRLGDWFKVEKLILQGHGDDAMLMTAWNKIGEYYADRQKWPKAVQYFAQSKNIAMLIECFYALEDYESLEKLIGTLPEGDERLSSIGEKFASIGLSQEAVSAYLKSGDIKGAIDCCVMLNQWDIAVQLAQRTNDTGTIEDLYASYTKAVMEQGKPVLAVELYRKTKRHTEAARLLSDMAKEAIRKKESPVRIKQLFVLAALEVDYFRMGLISGGAKGDEIDLDTYDMNGVGDPVGQGAGVGVNATLEGLIHLEAEADGNDALRNPWRGAELVHFWLLAHRQLYAGQFQDALNTALLIQDAEAHNMAPGSSIFEQEELQSFIALSAFYGKQYNKCSKAFMRLETLHSIDDEKKAKYTALAAEIFTSYPTTDSGNTGRRGSVTRARELLNGVQDEAEKGISGACVVTGRQLGPGDAITLCQRCKHRMYTPAARGRRSCPLCHYTL